MTSAKRLAIAMAALSCGGVVCAQPRITGVFNEADRSCCDRATPGAITLIGGFELGPAVARVHSGFPLVTSLAGTSVRFTAGTAVAQAFVLAVESRWVRVLLPSSFPPGTAEVTVTSLGSTSTPRLVEVVEHSFSIYDSTYESPEFSPRQRGVHNISRAGEVSLNSPVNPARTGQLAELWGTGLGAAAGDESAGPIPGALQTAPSVFVGNIPARVVYSGRSACCAGLDQIIFEIPEGIEGCNVPISVVFDTGDFPGNDTVISVASGTGACSDPHGLSEPEVRALAAGELKAAWISAMPETGNVQWFLGFGTATDTGVLPFGTCKATFWGTSPFTFSSRNSLNDAGPSITIDGPGGTVEARRFPANDYRAVSPGTLQPGSYIVRNGSGGPDVPAFETRFLVPPTDFTWSNGTDPASGDEGIAVSWSASGLETGRVVIRGSLSRDGETCGTCAFVCVEQANRGRFTIPFWVIRRAQASAPFVSEVSVQVDLQMMTRFAIPGFGIGEFSTTVAGDSRIISRE